MAATGFQNKVNPLTFDLPILCAYWCLLLSMVNSVAWFAWCATLQLGTKCSAVTYDMGFATNLPISLSHGHICCECLPDCTELQSYTEITDGSETVPSGEAMLQFVSDKCHSLVCHTVIGHQM